MSEPETYIAVLDRFEGEQAILVIEREGTDVEDRILTIDRLPEDGQHVDAVFQITIDGDEIVAVEYNSEMTENRAESAQRRFDRLSKRPPREDDDEE